MRDMLRSGSLIADFNYGRFFAKEKRNDFLIIMRIVSASSFFDILGLNRKVIIPD
jgi:hypothetical protein